MADDTKELDIWLDKHSTTDHAATIKITREVYDYLTAKCRLDVVKQRQMISLDDLVVGLSKQVSTD